MLMYENDDGLLNFFVYVKLICSNGVKTNIFHFDRKLGVFVPKRFMYSIVHNALTVIKLNSAELERKDFFASFLGSF